MRVVTTHTTMQTPMRMSKTAEKPLSHPMFGPWSLNGIDESFRSVPTLSTKSRDDGLQGQMGVPARFLRHSSDFIRVCFHFNGRIEHACRGRRFATNEGAAFLNSRRVRDRRSSAFGASS